VTWQSLNHCFYSMRLPRCTRNDGIVELIEVPLKFKVVGILNILTFKFDLKLRTLNRTPSVRPVEFRNIVQWLWVDQVLFLKYWQGKAVNYILKFSTVFTFPQGAFRIPA